MKWNLIYKGKKPKNVGEIEEIIFENRGLKSKKEIEEYLNPKKVDDLDWKDLDININDVKKVVERIKTAKEKKEKVIIFGDYDCDGVCSTVIVWETLYKKGFDCMPYIPDRFSEGYGLKEESLELLFKQFEKVDLIVCVDNGIVAYDAIESAKNKGIDVVVVDNHRKENEKLKTDYIIHSTKSCGSVLSYFLSREFNTKEENKKNIDNTLELACIGALADQMPLTNINRSIIKYGLNSLNATKRVGLKEIYSVSGITKIGTYEVGFMIAPRINAAGRLVHAIDALRLLCTKDKKKAEELAKKLNQTNFERQKIVESVLNQVLKSNLTESIIVLDGDYHEGVIGLASGRVTEKTYRPSIIISKQNEKSKASARSIEGFNIIEAIKETNLILEGGGHPMAAGFSIETSKITEFKLKIQEISREKLTTDLLEKKLKIDLEIDFENITNELVEFIKKMEPFGINNFSPVFKSESVEILETKTVGSDGKHIKLKLKQNNNIFDAIWFNAKREILENKKVDIVYTIDENIWNNKTTIQLNIKDIV